MGLSNVRIGACSVKFKTRDVGHTLEGVEFNFERSFEDLKVDKYGDMPVDMALTGHNLTIKFKMAEVTLANLDVAIPEGGYQSSTGGTRVNLGTDAGYLLAQDAGELVLHPLKNAASDLTEDIVVYKAVSVEAVPLNYKVNEQRVVEVTMRALVSEDYADGRRLGHIGVTNIS